MTGPELRSKREALGVSQHKLAIILGVVGETVSRWETGKRKIDRRTEIAFETGYVEREARK